MRAAPSRPGWVLRLARRAVLLVVAAAAAVAVIRWQATLNWLGNYLVCSDASQPADLVLVMGGDFWGPRVVNGAAIGAQGLAPLVLISGPLL